MAHYRDRSVATTSARTSQKRKSTAKKRSTAKSGSSRASAGTKKSTAKKRSAAKPPASTGDKIADVLGQTVDGRGHDAWGFVCMALALVSVVGIWLGKGAIIGAGVNRVAATLFGMGRIAVPVALVALGVRLFTEEKRERQSFAVALGGFISVVSIFALMHLTRLPVGWPASLDNLGKAGGLAGSAVGLPLRAALGNGLATILAIVGTFAGILIGTRTTVAEVKSFFEFVFAVPVGVLDSARAAYDPDPDAGLVQWDESDRDGLHSAHPDLADDDFGYEAEDGYADDDDPERSLAPDGYIYEHQYADDPEPELDAEPDQTPTFGGMASLLGAGQSVHPLATSRDDLDANAGAAADAGVELDAWGKPIVFDQDTDASTGPIVRNGDAAVDGEQVLAAPPPRRRRGWKLPPRRMLDRGQTQRFDAKAVNEAGRTLVNALREHGVETRLVGKVVGPTVTRFELELAPGVRVKQVISHDKDIAYAMASPDVRILAPVPGKQAVGVEVPNVNREVVKLGDILSSPEARAADHPLEVAIGRDIKGISVLENLAQLPHLLIAGATGAGKSSCINSLITSLLMRSTPDQVRMILVDPKRVELTQYDRIPHLLTQVVTDPKKAANALAWAVKEMERRYDLLSGVGVRDITGYNEAFDKGKFADKANGVDANGEPKPFERLPFILVVVDELADLMMVAARDVEDSICRLAQMARAVGIHLVIATQRPSTNVITGVIKANVPARLAFQVSSMVDSRVVLDQPGAERLVGKGDMLLLGPTSSVPRRIQGAWVTEEEVREIVGHWRDLAPDVEFDEAVQDDANATPLPGMGNAGGGSGGSGGSDDDELLAEAIQLVVDSQLGSTSMLQRKLRVGFARAGRIMDLMEQQGVVGPSTGSKAREVLISPEELAGGGGGAAPEPEVADEDSAAVTG